MARKRTLEEIDAQIRATEERLRKQRAARAQATEVERKKQNAEIVRAVDEWNASLLQPIKRENLPDLFRRWAEKNRQKNGNGVQG